MFESLVTYIRINILCLFCPHLQKKNSEEGHRTIDKLHKEHTNFSYVSAEEGLYQMDLPSVLASSESHDAEQNLVGRMKFSTPDGKLVQFHLKLGFFASVVALGLVDHNEISN